MIQAKKNKTCINPRRASQRSAYFLLWHWWILVSSTIRIDAPKTNKTNENGHCKLIFFYTNLYSTQKPNSHESKSNRCAKLIKLISALSEFSFFFFFLIWVSFFSFNLLYLHSFIHSLIRLKAKNRTLSSMRKTQVKNQAQMHENESEW